MDSMHVKRTDSVCCGSVSRSRGWELVLLGCSRRGGPSEGESSVLKKGVGDDFIN